MSHHTTQSQIRIRLRRSGGYRLRVGTAPIGKIFREIDQATSDALIQSAWDHGVRYYNTPPMFGHGLAERRTDHSLRWKTRDDFVLSSKVGRRLVPAKRESIDFAPWTNAAPFVMEFDYTHARL